MSTKAVRFSEKEDKQIKEFLEKNPFFDFSTLARMSIMNFITDPKIEMTPISNKKQSDKKGTSHGSH